MKKDSLLNKLIVHPDFEDTLNDLNEVNIKVPKKPVNQELDYYNYMLNGDLLKSIGDIDKIKLNPKNGETFIDNDRQLMGYDESINKFESLEGTTYMASHSLIFTSEYDFIPINNITLYFYTRSKKISESVSKLKYSDDPNSDSKKDFIRDKIEFIKNNTLNNSILLIDGPLIAGDWYVLMVKAIEELHEKNIIPVFFVKNSTSNLVIENIKDFMGEFNSDMHWSYNFLNEGERTNFFKYTDSNNPKNSKVFSYLKAFNVSPQRIEFHIDTFNRYNKIIPDIMDLIYYLILVQGDYRNPQVRQIAIAEKYARETLKLFDLSKLMKKVGIVPTMNQERFAW